MVWDLRGVVPTRTRTARVSVVTLAAFLPLAVGCTSNEYVIPHDELARLAETPLPQRGARVHVVQDLGERRSDPVDVTMAERPPSEWSTADDERDEDGPHGNVNIDLSTGQRQPRRRRSTSINGSGGPGSSAAGRSASPASPSWRAAPPRPSGGGGGRISGGGHFSGGGGGGGNGDAVLVVVIVVVAVVVAVALVSSEGVRFDGYVAMSPDQPVHLRDASGEKTTISVGELSSGWVDGAVEAKVMDDEGFGILRLDRAPLDRRGGTFKLDSGTIAFDVAGVPAVGPAMNVQAGYFFTRRLGLLANLGLGGVGVPQGLVPRHALGLELQAFPLALGPLHLGLFGNGGMALTKVLVGPTPAYISGPSVGGGALAELDLTSRMALTLRAGADLAKLDQVWTPAGLLTAGVAVY